MEKQFNTKIYSHKALKTTIEAFNQLAVFDLKHESDHYKVRVARLLDPDVGDRLMDEFGNYALYQTIAEKKQWQ